MRWCDGVRPSGQRWWSELADDAEGLGDDWIVCGCRRLWACDSAQRAIGRKCKRCGSPRPPHRRELCSDECARAQRLETHARYREKMR